MLATNISVLEGVTILSMTEPVRYHIGEFPPKAIDWPRLIPLIGPAIGRRPAILVYPELLNVAEGREVF